MTSVCVGRQEETGAICHSLFSCILISSLEDPSEVKVVIERMVLVEIEGGREVIERTNERVRKEG